MDGKRRGTVNSRPVEYGICTLPIPILKEKKNKLLLWRKKQLAFDAFVLRLSASSLNEKKKAGGRN